MAPPTETEEVDFGDNVDMPTFEQIREMDDEDDGSVEFSKTLVFDFLEQANNTFGDMDKRIEEKDLDTLSSLGHFLKGSSATLGFVHIRDACEKIQHLGHMKDETGNTDLPDTEKCLQQIALRVKDAKVAFKTIKELMTTYYDRLENA